MNEKLYDFFLNSFLNPLLTDKSITDISYNGKDIYYQSNVLGRKKYDLEISNENVQNFIRQIANMSEKTFCISNPILDVSINNFRINAVHNSVTRDKFNKAISFAIRKSTTGFNVSTILEKLPKEMLDYFNNAIKERKSIVVCGKTGSGKTEWQKYLISLIEKNSRIIIIDNIQELSQLELDYLDMTFWEVNENNKHITLEDMIENSLRFNPDWTIIAESRGKEMNSILNSLLTGHPIITTMHAKNLDLLPSRIMQMILQDDKAIHDVDTLQKDIYSSFNIGVHLKTTFQNGKIIRYIDEIKEYYPDVSQKTIYKHIESE